MVRVKKRPVVVRSTVLDIPRGLGTPTDIREEIMDMRDVLLGREPLPRVIVEQWGELALLEVADVYFGRACEIEQKILEAQDQERISKKGSYQQIRTQEIRSFKDMAKSAAERGSRRITYLKMLQEQEVLGREAV